MTTTFDTSSFVSKTMSDLGGLAAGKIGAVNLIPSLPGMGVVTSIHEQCEMLERQAPISTRIVRMEEIEAAQMGWPGDRTVDLDEARVVVVDVGTNNLAPRQQSDLVNFINQARNEAQVVWVVGGNTEAIAKALDGPVSQFQNILRGRRENAQSDSQPARGTSLKA